MNKNGALMQWQIAPYFIHFAQTIDSEIYERAELI